MIRSASSAALAIVCSASLASAAPPPDTSSPGNFFISLTGQNYVAEKSAIVILPVDPSLGMPGTFIVRAVLGNQFMDVGVYHEDDSFNAPWIPHRSLKATLDDGQSQVSITTETTAKYTIGMFTDTDGDSYAIAALSSSFSQNAPNEPCYFVSVASFFGYQVFDSIEEMPKQLWMTWRSTSRRTKSHRHRRTCRQSARSSSSARTLLATTTTRNSSGAEAASLSVCFQGVLAAVEPAAQSARGAPVLQVLA